MDEIIANIFAMKQGDQEFILSCQSPGFWFAAIGNTSSFAPIGEVLAGSKRGADFFAEGATAREALDELESQLIRAST